MSAPFHEEEALGRPYDAALVRRLVEYLRPYRGAVVLALLLLLASAVLQLAGPWVTRLVIDRAIPDRDVGFATLLGLAFAAAL